MSHGTGGGAATPTTPLGYPEAFYAHTHKTPERSNRQKKVITTPATEPITTPDSENHHHHHHGNGGGGVIRRPPGSSVLGGGGGRVVGRLRPQQLNLFHNNNNNNSNSHNNSSSNGNNNGKGNVGNGYSHIQQQILRQQQPQSPPAIHASVVGHHHQSLQPSPDPISNNSNNNNSSSNHSVASSVGTTSAFGGGSQATLAATIPSSHVNIITQAYGNQVDIYRDILQIPPTLTSEREIRIAYFRRGRQVLAEKPPNTAAATTDNNNIINNAGAGADGDSNNNNINMMGGNVTQLAKMKFQAVSMAYEILSNPAWKESYDLYGLHGPDTFQEPEGASVLFPGDDASALMMTTTPTQQQNQNQNQNVATTVIENSNGGIGNLLLNNITSETNNHATNSDNVSFVSQSTTGTATSATNNNGGGGGVLRKKGSFLEKLNNKKRNKSVLQHWDQARHNHHHNNNASSDGRHHRNSNSSNNNNSTTGSVGVVYGENNNTTTSNNHNQNSDNNYNQQSSSSSSYNRPPSHNSVRWNEEVEELIFRQDPDEISFKAGIAPVIVEEESPPHPQQQQRQQQHLQQAPVPMGHQHQQQEQQPLYQSRYINPNYQQQQQQRNDAIAEQQQQQDPGYRQHAGAAKLQDSYPARKQQQQQQQPLASALKSTSANSNNKERLVLDTTELGTHLEKLDKVADSIGYIFDELEASFDGLLGGFGTGTNATKPSPTNNNNGNDAMMVMSNGGNHHHHHHNPTLQIPSTPSIIPSSTASKPTTTVPAVPPLLPPPSHMNHQNQNQHQQQQGRIMPTSTSQPQQQQQQQQTPQQPIHSMQTVRTAPAADDGNAGIAFMESRPQFEESSYHTPPISVGSSAVLGAAAAPRQEEMQVQVAPTATSSTTKEQQQQEEFQSVEEQAMALMREVAEFEVKTKPAGPTTTTAHLTPPSDVVVKTKKNKHIVDMGEATSLLCASDMAAGGGENNTVATGGDNTTVATSVVSLLDPQQHTNAPLKPAASTEVTTGVKASRKRLKNVQRRRQQQQQQRALEQQQFVLQQQQEQENQLFDFIDPLGVLNTPIVNREYVSPPSVKGLSVKDRTNQWNQLANSSSFVNPSKNTKKSSNKKKQTEDLYFESLYQNFFALPKERLPHEMTVRAKPSRGGCSVSTLSHSVTTAPDSSKFDSFDPWGLANSTFSKAEKSKEKERRSRHQRQVMAKVDEVLAHRSDRYALDDTFDSSFPDDFGLDTTCDSGTGLDTTFDSTLVDTVASSAVDVPRNKSGHIAAAISGCDQTPGVAFLNDVFDVPLEAPLEYWCGEMKDCASSAPKPKRRPPKIPKEKVKASKQKKSSKVKKEETSSVEASTSGDSAVLEEDGPPTDESVTLMDPPTHDSRMDVGRCDDSTLNTLNTNNVEESSSSQSDPSSSSNKHLTRMELAVKKKKKDGKGAAKERLQRVLVGLPQRDPSIESPRQMDIVRNARRDPSVASVESSDNSAFFVKDPPIDMSKDSSSHDASKESPSQVAHKDPVNHSPSKDSARKGTGSPLDKEIKDPREVNDSGRDSPNKKGSFTKDPSKGSVFRDVDDSDPSKSPGRRIFNVSTASESQFVQITASDSSSEQEAIETASVSSPVPPLLPELPEEREGVSTPPHPPNVNSSKDSSEPSNQGQVAKRSDEITSPSSLSGRRVAFQDVSTKQNFPVEVQDEGMESSATSVCSAVSNDKSRSSSFVTYMLNILSKATDENPSLACIKANLTTSLESCRASNDACMDAIVISDDDMAAMLDILQNEMKRPRPGFMAKSE